MNRPPRTQVETVWQRDSKTGRTVRQSGGQAKDHSETPRPKGPLWGQQEAMNSAIFSRNRRSLSLRHLQATQCQAWPFN